MSEIQSAIDALDGDVLIVAARCQGCERSYPMPPSEYPRNIAEIQEEVEAQWRSLGRSDYLQPWAEWPKRLPMRWVREGFACPICEAPDMLLSLEPLLEDLRIRQFPEGTQ